MTQASRQTVPQDSSPSSPLTPEALDQHARAYNETGFVVLPNVVPKAQLRDLTASIMGEFKKLSESSSLFSGGGLISGHLNCYPGAGSRFALDAIREHGVIELVKAVATRPESLGDIRVGLNLNLPGSAAQHYHADGVFRQAFVIVNVALVDTEIANGAIDVLPGTHKSFYPFWRYAIERAYRLTTRVPMKQGDVLIRSSVLWHRGMPNFTNTARPMMAFTFGDKGAHDPDPFQSDGGKIKFHPNWFRPTALGRLRERVSVKVPITYSAYRFARSLYGRKGDEP